MGITLEQLRERRPSEKTIDVPEWGGPVTLKRLTAREQLDVAAGFETLDVDTDQARGVLAMCELIRRTVVDDSGELIFDSTDGREYLARESIATLSRVGNEAMAMHNFGEVEETAQEQKKS